MLHGDIKTSNVFLTRELDLKLGDFGTATNLASTVKEIREVTGTPLFFSPEVVRGEAHSFKADVWSLGVVLFNVMSLRFPFFDLNLGSLLTLILEQEPPELPPVYSEELRSFVLSLLAKEQDQRPDVDQLVQSAFFTRALARFPEEQLKLTQFKPDMRMRITERFLEKEFEAIRVFRCSENQSVLEATMGRSSQGSSYFDIFQSNCAQQQQAKVRDRGLSKFAKAQHDSSAESGDQSESATPLVASPRECLNRTVLRSTANHSEKTIQCNYEFQNKKRHNAKPKVGFVFPRQQHATNAKARRPFSNAGAVVNSTQRNNAKAVPKTSNGQYRTPPQKSDFWNKVFSFNSKGNALGNRLTKPTTSVLKRTQRQLHAHRTQKTQPSLADSKMSFRQLSSCFENDSRSTKKETAQRKAPKEGFKKNASWLGFLRKQNSHCFSFNAVRQESNSALSKASFGNCVYDFHGNGEFRELLKCLVLMGAETAHQKLTKSNTFCGVFDEYHMGEFSGLRVSSDQIENAKNVLLAKI